MSIYRREIDAQCCNQWMNGIRTINGQYPDDNRDFDINAGSGIVIQPATGGITIINSAQAQAFVAGDNIEITPSGSDLEIRVKDDIAVDNIDVSQDADITGNVNVGGDLNVSGDIIQQGSSYETHAEQVYTTKDYIIMRDGAVGALAAGSYSGFQVKKYDGTNDGRLVIDKDGIARVGDVGDEQPLMTRDESADMTDGNLIEWDATNNKAVDAGTNVSAINTAIDGKISGTGNIGSDTKPIKIVNGAATAISKDVLTVDGGILNTNKPLVFNSEPYNAGLQIRASSATGDNIQILNVYNNQNQSLMGLYLSYDTTNGTKLNASLRNANGTYRFISIA